MYILLILFFISLFGIILLVGKKLKTLQKEKILNREKNLLKTRYLEELKHLAIKNARKHGYKGLVIMIRLYIQSTNFLKNKYDETKIRIKSLRDKRKNKNPNQSKEVSKFLKIVSEYKNKIREIKHRIKEEEGSL